jgi:hypothetical protein
MVIGERTIWEMSEHAWLRLRQREGTTESEDAMIYSRQYANKYI